MNEFWKPIMFCRQFWDRAGYSCRYVCLLLIVKPADLLFFYSYDTHGVFSAPRALFMFRAFGHTNSSILNGGLPLWEVEGFPIESGAQEPLSTKTTYPVPNLDEDTVRSSYLYSSRASWKNNLTVVFAN